MRCLSSRQQLGDPRVEDDGLYLPPIGVHSLEKIRRHNFYAAIFAKAMRSHWKHVVYVGLYSGAGRAFVKGAGGVVETSAMGVLRQDPPFTKYIFVDSDERCIHALRSRISALPESFDVTLIHRPVNESVPDIFEAMPSFSPSRGEGLLTLCFIDPFRLDLDFGVIRAMSRFRIDFLIMLPLGFDLRRNFRRYLLDEDDTRVGEFLDAPNWRAEWRRQGRADRAFIRFALEKFDDAMVRLGFRGREMRDTVSVKVTGMGVHLYSLALYSRHELGEKFWRTTVSIAETELGLDLDGA